MKQTLPAWPRIYAVVSFACLISFSLATIAMHIVNVSLGVRVPWYLSHFATGPTFWAWTLALFGLGIGGLCMARAMTLCLPSTRWRTTAITLLCTMSVGVFIMAIFPSEELDPFSVQSQIHIGAAIPTFVAMAGGVIATAIACRQDEAWRRFGTSGLALALPILISVGLFVMLMQMEHPSVGAAERFMVYVVVTWFAAIAGQAIRVTPRSHPSIRRTA